jgi:hypothetical protein
MIKIDKLNKKYFNKAKTKLRLYQIKKNLKKMFSN